jgi:hypothetical protein
MPSVYLAHPTKPDAENVEVEFKVTSYGSGPSWEHPGDPPEIEVEAVREDAGEGADILPGLTGDQAEALHMLALEHGDFSPPEPDDYD